MSKPNVSLPRAMKEWAKRYTTKEDVKAFWLEAGKMYYQSLDWNIYKHQEIQFKENILRELDTTKIEKILEVGVGYGRIAKILLDNIPSITQYDGIDISQEQLDKSLEYVRSSDYSIGYNGKYWAYKIDFDNIQLEYWRKYDLVIAVEYFTCLPYDIQQELDKMIKLSKKYVVTMDHFTMPREFSLEDNILRNWHDYPKWYIENKDIVNLKGVKIPEYKQSMFIGRVR